MKANDLNDIKKYPIDTLQLFGSGAAQPVPAFPTAPSTATGSGPPAAAPSEAPGSTMFRPPDDDDAELLALGLPAVKAQRKAKAKPKRSRNEMVEEDVARMTSEVQSVVNSLTQFPAAPKAQDFGRVDRMIHKKKNEMKDQFDFEAANELGRLWDTLELLRQAWKPAHGFMTGTPQTRKKWITEFTAKMGELYQKRPDIFKKFPSETVAAYLECDVAARVDKMEWEYLAKLVSKEELEKIGADPIPTFEKVVAFYIKKMEAITGSPDRIEGQVRDFGKELSSVLQLLAEKTNDDVKTSALALAEVVGLKPFKPDSTMEVALALVVAGQKEPLLRVFHDSAVCRELLRIATQTNAQLVAQLDANVAMSDCCAAFQAMLSDELLDFKDPFNWQACKDLLDEFGKKIVAFGAICSDEQLQKQGSRALEGANLYASLLEKVLNGVSHLLVTQLAGFSKVLIGNAVLELKGEVWLTMKGELVANLLEALKLGTCSEKGLASLGKRLQQLKILPPATISAINKSIALHQFASWLANRVIAVGYMICHMSLSCPVLFVGSGPFF